MAPWVAEHLVGLLFYSIIFPSLIYETKREWSLMWPIRLGLALTGIVVFQIVASSIFIRWYDRVRVDPFNVNQFRQWIWQQFDLKHAEKKSCYGNLEILCWFTYKFTPPMVAILLRREKQNTCSRLGRRRERRVCAWSIALATLYSLCIGLGASLPLAGKIILLELICLRFLIKASTRPQPHS